MHTLTILSAGSSLIVAVFFIYKSYTGTAKERLFSKGIASFLFLLTAIFGYLTPTKGENVSAYAVLLLCGLIFGLIGDVLLEMQAVYPEKKKTFFISGLVSFLLGHIFYIILLMRLTRITSWHLIVSILVFLLVLYLQKVTRSDPGAMLLPVRAYAAIISLMLGFAAGAYIADSTKLTLILLIAAILFLISDLLLAYIQFGPKEVKALRACNLSCYYVAQVLFALTMLIR